MEIKTTMYEFGATGLVKIDKIKWSNLEPGRVLYFNGYSNDSYVIIRKGSGEFYKTINLRTFIKRNQEFYTLKHISEKKDNRIQVYVTDETYDTDQILEAISKSKQAEEAQKAEAALAEKERNEARERLIKEYSHLERVPEGSYKHRVIGAKNIRKELKDKFPGVKFSVRSESFSGGDAINVYYPKDFEKENIEFIDNLCRRYQEGTFDGMQDLYEYDNKIFNGLFGGAKYVHCQREWK